MWSVCLEQSPEVGSKWLGYNLHCKILLWLGTPLVPSNLLCWVHYYLFVHALLLLFVDLHAWLWFVSDQVGLGIACWLPAPL